VIGLVEAPRRATAVREEREPTELGLGLLLVALVLAGSLSVTYLLWNSARRDAADELRDDFYLRVRDAEARITQRMSAHEQVLRGAAGLFAASHEVERSEFREYVAAQRLDENYPGIQGVGFASLVPAAERARYVAAVRKEGFRTFSILPEGERDPYTSILYLEPFSGRNLRALGYDMFSEPIRRAAMEAARDSGLAALSGKVTLVQETARGPQAGCLLYLAVYRNGAPHQDVLERRANLVGWVYEPFRMGDLMSGVMGERESELDLRVYDGSAVSEATLMYGTVAARAPARFEVMRVLTVAGHTWTLVVRSTPELEGRLLTAKSTLVAVIGTGASLFLILIVWSLANARARAIRTARRMNWDLIQTQQALVKSAAELRSREEQLALVIEGSDDGYWDWDLVSGEMKHDTRHAKMLGLGSEPVPWRRQDFEAYVHPEDRQAVAAALDAHLAGKTLQFDAEYRIRRASGRWLWLRSRAKVVGRDAEGRPVRVAGTVSDVDERHRAEEEHRLLAAITRNMGDAVVITDTKHRVTGWTGAAEQLYGISADEALGHEVGELLPDEFPDGDGEAKLGRLESEGHARLYARHRRRDGGYLDLDLCIEALLDEGGRHIGYFGVNRDITRQKAAERALKESEARFRAMADSAPVLIWVSAADKGCTWFNRPWLEFTGRDLDQEMGKGWMEGVYPDDLPRYQRLYEEHFDRRQPFTAEYRLRRRDGEHRWLIASGTPRFDEGGTFTGYIGSCIDITDRKWAEDAIRAAQRFAQATLDAMSEQLCVLDENGVIIAVNAAWRAFALANGALEAPVFEGSSYLRVCLNAQGPGSSEGSAFAALLGDVLAGRRQSCTFEYPCHSPDEMRWFVASATRFAEEGLVRVVVAHTDITRRKKVELELLDSQALLRGIVETTPDPVYVKDEGGRFLLANPAMLKAIGKPLEAVLGKLSREFHDDPTVSSAIAENDRSVMRSGTAGVFEELIHSPEGKRVYLSTRSARRDGEGRITGIIGISRDISDRKRLELERERLLEEAWTATQRREQMLAVVAHDLRSPLGAVVLASHGLGRFCSDAALRHSFDERLEIIRTATERMGRLIEDLLDVAAIQSGRLRLALAANDPAVIAREAVRVALSEAQRRDLRLVLETEEILPTVRCDRGRIVQVLSNLLSNAFHATDRGGAVTVRVKPSALGAVFSVADTGRGLPPGKSETLFEPYQRGPNPGYKGAGLGLAIARGILEGHSGRIWAETPSNGGATFCFELPRA